MTVAGKSLIIHVVDSSPIFKIFNLKNLNSTVFNLNDANKEHIKSEKMAGPTPSKRKRKSSSGKGKLLSKKREICGGVKVSQT